MHSPSGSMREINAHFLAFTQHTSLRKSYHELRRVPFHHHPILDEMESSTVPIQLSETRATDQAFSNSLIFGHILHQLPMLDILHNARRVNKIWNTSIKTNAILQKKLFFMGDDRERCIRFYRCPLHCCESDDECHFCIRDKETGTGFRPYKAHLLNPALVKQAGIHGRGLGYFFKSILQPGGLPNKELSQSWRSALFAQPPLKELVLEWKEQNGKYSDIRITSEKGITLGMIRDQVREQKPQALTFDGFTRARFKLTSQTALFCLPERRYLESVYNDPDVKKVVYSYHHLQYELHP